MISIGRYIKVKSINSTSKPSDFTNIDLTTTNFDHSTASIFPAIFSYSMPKNQSKIHDWNEDFVIEVGNSTDEDGPPGRLVADYVEMGILIVMVLIGGPLNFLSLFRSLRSDPPVGLVCLFRICGKCLGTNGEDNYPKSNRRLFDLKIHLTVANLLIIWVYALSDLCWLITYQWLGGDTLCRLIRFIHAFCFYATSNLVCTIALQRLNVAMKLEQPGQRRSMASRPNRTNRYTDDRNRLAYGAWTLAFLCSIPQLFIWRTFELYPDWQQCVTTWTIERYEYQNENEKHQIDDHIESIDIQEKLYNGFHLAFVFWLPSLIIFVSYALIVTRFQRKIRKQAMQIAAEATAEAESRAATVRASLVVGGPVDAGSPLLLPIAIFRSLQYQSIENGGTSGREIIRVPQRQQRRRTTVRQRRKRWLCPNFIHGHRFRSNSRFNCAFDDDDEMGSVTTAHILNATLIGAARPYTARKSFAMTTLSKAKRRTMKKTIWILTSYLLCWSPYNVLVLWRYVDRNVDLYDFEIMYNLIVLNAVINPLIYGI